MSDPAAPSFRLDGKRAIVTGGGRGLGFAIASALAEAGAHVTVVARTKPEIEELAASLRAQGFQCASQVLDVLDTPAVKRSFASEPAFDILVNNAGTNRPKLLQDVTEQDYDAIVDLNLRSAFFVSQSFAGRLMAEGRPGSIINITSQMGHVGAARRSVYCLTKHALEGLTKALAVELAPQGIRVNAVAPTFIETPMTKPFFEDPAFRAEVLSKIKLGRIGVPSDVTGAVIFLASAAAGLITGTSLKVDGGWTAE